MNLLNYLMIVFASIAKIEFSIFILFTNVKFFFFSKMRCLDCTRLLLFIGTLVRISIIVLSCYYLIEKREVDDFNDKCSTNVLAYVSNGTTVIQIYQCIYTDKNIPIISKPCITEFCNTLALSMIKVKYCIVDNDDECSHVPYRSYTLGSNLWIVVVLAISTLIGSCCFAGFADYKNDVTYRRMTPNNELIEYNLV